MKKRSWGRELDKKKVLTAVCVSVAMLLIGLGMNIAAQPEGNEQAH